MHRGLHLRESLPLTRECVPTSMHVPKHEAADDGHQNEESNNDAEVERERVRVQSCKGVPQCVNGVRERIDINQHFHPAGQRRDGEKRAAQERERR